MKKDLYLLICIVGAFHSQSFALTTVKPDPTISYQTIEGWGASMCWWAHMVGQWEDEEKIDDIVRILTSPDQLNMNIFRYNIGGGDDPSHYSTPEKPGHMARGKGVRAEMEGFKAGVRAAYNWSADAGQRKILLKIKAQRPEAIFEAFSNSPPYWMTYSGCTSGHWDADKDNLKPEYYGMFCDYLIDVCKHYHDAYGIEFKTLEPFNESQSDYWGYKGSQEGCHFDIASQIDLIRILHPKLQASGLETVIAASDETNVKSCIKALRGYIKAGDITNKLGQINTHTYAVTPAQRLEAYALTQKIGVDFWQSESGPIGIKGDAFGVNLILAQRMFDDLRHMKPVAWLDWQIMEEHNSTWCHLRGSFAKETYRPVKNLYVRMQVTRFIKQGYKLIESDNEQMLAAVSPSDDELVLVWLNTSSEENNINIDLTNSSYAMDSTSIYRTSEDEDCKKLPKLKIRSNRLRYHAPARSITTFVISK